MTLFASLNGTPVTKGRLVIPATGIWHADVFLDRVSDTTGPQSLIVNDLTGTCAVVRQVDFAGESMVRLVGGANGWSTVPQPAFYASPNLSTILNALALAVGEQVNIATDRSVDPFYIIDGASAASSVLQDLLGDTWWMDMTGVVQTGSRPTPSISSPYTLKSVDGPPGIYHVESDTIADWLPGATFSGPTGSGTVSRVTHVLDGGKLHSEIMVPSALGTGLTDRMRQAIEEILAGYLPNLLYLANWTYTVTSSSGGPSSVTIDANPVDPRLPPVTGLPLRADASGSVATPASGSTILVGFIGGDRYSPEIRGLDGSTPPSAFWIGQGTNPIARLGDQVQCFLPAGMPFTGFDTAGPVTGTIIAAAPISGVITQGSTTGQVQ